MIILTAPLTWPGEWGLCMAHAVRSRKAGRIVMGTPHTSLLCRVTGTVGNTSLSKIMRYSDHHSRLPCPCPPPHLLVARVVHDSVRAHARNAAVRGHAPSHIGGEEAEALAASEHEILRRAGRGKEAMGGNEHRGETIGSCSGRCPERCGRNGVPGGGRARV